MREVEIDRDAACLRVDGVECALRPKTFQVLLYLLDHRDRNVAKEEILEAVWPATAVTDDTLVQSIGDIRRTVGDDSRDSWFIRTIPRVGYRLFGSVRERLPIAPPEPAAELPIPPAPPRFRPAVILIAVAVFLVAVGAAAVLRSRNAMRPEAAASSLPTAVVVAHFDSHTASPDLEWLGDGLPEMVATQLARSPSLRLVRRDDVARLIHERSDPAEPSKWLEIARAARASRLIAGTFESSGGEIRVDAQIVDTETGGTIGGTSIVSSPQTLFRDVDVLSERLGTILRASLPAGESAAGAPRMTDSLEAYREYSLGLAAADGLRNTEALEHFQRALTLDRDFAMAEARIGYAYAVTWAQPEKAKPHLQRALQAGDRLDDRERLYVQGWSAIADRDFNGAIQHFRTIVAKFPNEVEAYSRLGRLLTGEERLEESIEVVQRGLIVDPDAAELYNTLGGAYSLLGRHQQAIAAHQRYVALRPREPNSHDSLAASYHWAGDYARAIDGYTEALRIEPRFEVARIHLAHAYWDLGRNREAIQEIERYAATGPSEKDRARGFSELFLLHRSLGDRAREAEAADAAIRYGDPPEPYALRMAIDRRDVAGVNKAESSVWVSGAARGARDFVRFRFALRAEAALARGDVEGAIRLAREAARHIPLAFYFDAFEDTLGDVLAASGRNAEAIDEYRRILRINPNRARTRYKLALVLEAAGHREESRAELQRFLAIWENADADAPELVDAKRRLGMLPLTDIESSSSQHRRSRILAAMSPAPAR
ncbi:MAG: tetratricopeptide repeat protein [Acidobacteria bacterium]|nr:tetratricopeptide repeat protein [Acidobacteriota bacterium]